MKRNFDFWSLPFYLAPSCLFSFNSQRFLNLYDLITLNHLFKQFFEKKIHFLPYKMYKTKNSQREIIKYSQKKFIFFLFVFSLAFKQI